MPAKKKSTSAASVKVLRAKGAKVAKPKPTDVTEEAATPAVSVVLTAMEPFAPVVIADSSVASTVAETVESFAELGLIPELVKAVEDAGYTRPTPIQA